MATSKTATAITPMNAKRVREPQYKRRKGVPRPRRSPHCFNQPPFGHILPMSKRISKEPHRENMSKPVSPKRCGSISLGVMSGRRQILIVHQKCGIVSSLFIESFLPPSPSGHDIDVGCFQGAHAKVAFDLPAQTPFHCPSCFQDRGMGQAFAWTPLHVSNVYM